MGDPAGLAVSAGIGFALGLLYFFGLWLTVRRLPRSRAPVPLLVGSWLLRTALALGVFYLVLRRGWEDLLAAVAGFVIARTLTFWLSRRFHHPGDVEPESVP